jgi:predicted metal-dependent peptidase
MDIRSWLDDLPGSVPLGWQRWANQLLEPRVDWRRALGAAIRSHVATVAGSVDYTYMRPSRRASVTRQVVLPAMRRPIPAIAVVVDTSASMDDDALARVLAEVDGILRAVGLGRSQVHVLACDTEVHKVQRLTSAHQVQLFGGGGTDMAAGIDAALALRPAPSVVVVLTDGLTPWPAEAPKRARVVAGILGRGEREAPEWTEAVQIESLV